MLKITAETLTKVAEAQGWTHLTGRLAGSPNARKMAEALGVSVSTVTRAYESGDFGPLLLERIHRATGMSFDELITVAPDPRTLESAVA